MVNGPSVNGNGNGLSYLLPRSHLVQLGEHLKVEPRGV